MIDLALTDEQQALVESFASLFAKASAPEQVREAEPGGFDPKLWATTTHRPPMRSTIPSRSSAWSAMPVAGRASIEPP